MLPSHRQSLWVLHVQALSVPRLTLTKRRDYSQSKILVMVSFVLKIKSFKSFTCPLPWANCTQNNTVWRVLHVLSTETCFAISVVTGIFSLWKIKWLLSFKPMTKQGRGPSPLRCNKSRTKLRVTFCRGIHSVLYLLSVGMRLTTTLAAKHADLLINK